LGRWLCTFSDFRTSDIDPVAIWSHCSNWSRLLVEFSLLAVLVCIRPGVAWSSGTDPASSEPAAAIDHLPLAEQQIFSSSKELLWVSVTPDGKQIVVETREEAASAAVESKDKGWVKISSLDADSMAEQRAIEPRGTINLDLPVKSVSMRLGSEEVANSHIGTLEISSPVPALPDAPDGARAFLPPVEPDGELVASWRRARKLRLRNSPATGPATPPAP